MSHGERIVVLRGTTDDDVVTMTASSCKLSGFITMLLADEEYQQQRVSCEERGGLGRPPMAPLEIPISTNAVPVSKAVLEKVKEYLEHFSGARCVARPAGIPKPLPGELQRYVSEWEYAFVRSLLVDNDVWSHDLLIEVMNVSLKLDIEHLRDLLCAWCAEQIVVLSKGNGTMDAAAQVRSFFGLPNEWTEEESENLRLEMEHFDGLNGITK